MNILIGIQNFLTLVNDNWTTILIVIGLIVGIFQKVTKYIHTSNDDKIAIAKQQIGEIVLKLITDAETDYTEWNKAGSIKRSQVIEAIFDKYPILSKISNQEEVVAWIDAEIDNALKTLRNIIKENQIKE